MTFSFLWFLSFLFWNILFLFIMLYHNMKFGMVDFHVFLIMKSKNNQK